MRNYAPQFKNISFGTKLKLSSVYTSLFPSSLISLTIKSLDFQLVCQLIVDSKFTL